MLGNKIMSDHFALNGKFEPVANAREWVDGEIKAIMSIRGGGRAPFTQAEAATLLSEAIGQNAYGFKHADKEAVYAEIARIIP